MLRPMRILLSAMLLTSLGVFAACQNDPEASAKSQAAAPATPAPGYRLYGEALPGTEALSLAKVLESPAAFKDKPVLLEGEVRRACSRKGCWMELADSMEKNSPGFRVTFKDYGFFVPTDSAGAHARVHGVVQVETVKASHVQHMEEEGATFAKKNPDGSAEEVRLVATGVELRR